jgi:putative flippase GtrA
MSWVETKRQEHIRFTKFLVVGIIGAIVDFGIMNFLSHVINLSLTLSGSISFICAVLSNFIWNRYWTYPDSRSRPMGHQLGMFFIVNLAGIAIRIPILHFMEPVLINLLSRFSIPVDGLQLLARNGTLALAIGVVTLWNFFVNRYWTYNDVDKVIVK